MIMHYHYYFSVMPIPCSQTICCCNTLESQTICCCNIFRAAKGLTIAEIVLIFSLIGFGFGRGLGSGICWTLLQLAYLAVEFYGIHKKNKFLILFGCVIRILETISVVILIIVFNAVPICPNMFGRNACDEHSQSGVTYYQVNSAFR